MVFFVNLKFEIFSIFQIRALSENCLSVCNDKFTNFEGRSEVIDY